MNLKKEYNQLYQHWLKEIEELTLTPLSEEKFQTYRNFRDWIEARDTTELKEIELEIKKTYQDNVNYLYNDFLKLREEKIINAALNLNDIDLELMTEAEKLLFQNLVSTLKGYKKIKALSTFKEKEEIIKEPPTSPDNEPIEKKIIISPLEQPLENISIPEPVKSSEPLIKYVLIRFLKAFEDRLVGNDLLDYGPFEENSIVNIPFENAIILINEKYAEEIDAS